MGFEGLFGMIGTLGIMAPIAYYLPGNEGEGIHENIVDTVKVCDVCAPPVCVWWWPW